MTSNDHWPLPISIGFLYSLCWINIVRMKFNKYIHFWVFMLTRYFRLWPIVTAETFDLHQFQWGTCTYLVIMLTRFSAENVTTLVFNEVYPHHMYEVYTSFSMGDIVISRFSDFDQCWLVMGTWYREHDKTTTTWPKPLQLGLEIHKNY